MRSVEVNVASASTANDTNNWNNDSSYNARTKLQFITIVVFYHLMCKNSQNNLHLS